MKIILCCSFIFFIVFSVGVYFKIDYDRRISSSNALIDLIYNQNDDFLKKNHTKGYKIIKDVLEYKNHPTIEIMDKFAKIDGYLFKSLFYFSKTLFFNYKDDFSSYYESDKNPWSKLMITSKVFHDEKNIGLLKNKEEYVLIFAIGKGLQC